MKFNQTIQLLLRKVSSYQRHLLMKTVILVFFLSLAQTSFSQRIYVRSSATGLNNGTSWTNAYTNLQDALDEFSFSEIWVAQGIYTPSREPDGESNSKKWTFYVGFVNRQIYGGFNGTETMLSQRDPRKNLTRLSGANNSYHVMITANLSNSSIIDGFTFRQGNANAVGTGSIIFSGNTYLARYGGGMYNYKSSPNISNCIFENNFATGGGGGMHNRESSPTLTNCSFISNSTDNSGGGMENFVSSSPTLVNCTFLSNTAIEGGGMYNYQTLSTATFTNCSFANNSATSDGGAIYNTESSPKLINCTLFSNTAEVTGGGMYNAFITNAPAVVSVSNSIISGNTAETGNNIANSGDIPSISSSIIGGSGGSISWNPAFGTDGGNNLDLDPLFINAIDPDGLDDILGTIDDGLRLSVNSPAIDAGALLTTTVTDILGNPRNYNGAVDIGAYEFQGMPFITTWVTSDGQITIPTIGEGYDYDLLVVNQSNASDVFSLFKQTSNATITGLTNGATYRVEITGDFPRIYFNSGSEKDKIQTIEQWGAIVWENMHYAFFGCSNLTYNAADAPNLSSVTDMSNMFTGASAFNGAIGNWDVAFVTDMSNLFLDAIVFNQDLASWDVSAVTTMESMFQNATAYNNGGVALSWGNATVNLTDVSRMFLRAENFNQSIEDWDISSLTSLSAMLAFTAFNQPLNNWNVSSVTNFDGFLFNTPFNQPLDMWDLSSATNLRSLFSNTPFNQDIGNWDVSKVTIFSKMFESAESFNQDLSSWITSSASDMSDMFASAVSFDQPVNGWDVSSVTDMNSMFGTFLSKEMIFNQPLDNWDVSQVTDFNNMFAYNSFFDQDLSAWDVSSATNMRGMFRDAIVFNNGGVPLSWGEKTAGVTDMVAIFDDARLFNVPINDWNVAGVTNMSSMFRSTQVFNQPLDAWDVSNVSEFDRMFWDAENFNQDLSSWNTSSVENMEGMFYFATDFDQNIGSWDMTGILNADDMLDDSGMTVENYDATLLGWFSQSLQPDVNLGAEGLIYSSAGLIGRNILTDAPNNWIITGDELLTGDASLENDSLALAALYTSTNGANWINRSNWLTSELSTWFGVTVADGRVTQLELPDNNLKGNVPETFTNLTGIQVINLEGNELTSFPDMSSVESFIVLNLARNRLTFKHLLPNRNITGISYAGQKRFGTTLYDTLNAGSDFVLTAQSLASGSLYQWKFGKLIPGQRFNNEVSNITSATNASYTISDIDIKSQGTYRLSATHPDLPGLTIESRNHNIMAKTDFSGKISVTRNSVTSVVNDAEVFVWRQTPSGPFVKEDSAKVNNTGDYLFEDIVLGKFVVVAKPDREKPAYKDVLQTYYVSEITYKKADTLNLDGFAENINIDLQTYKITPPVINGAIIRGFVTEEFEENIPDEEASRILARRKVRKAACSMRKFKSTGRSEQSEDELEDEIAYYIETDDEGYFNFTGVAEGRYSLNIEFPGVPMDPNSAIEFVIGGDKENQIFDVNVLVKQTQIEVKLNDILFSVRPHIKDIKLYPNPTEGSLSFDYTVYRKLNNLKVQLLNSQGVILEERPMEYRKATYHEALDLTPYSTGVYFIVFTDKTGSFAQHIKVSKR